MARGKYLTPEKAEGGTAHCIALFTLGYDREMRDHKAGMMIEGLPDCDAVFGPDDIRAGWQEDTPVAIPDITRLGRALGLAPRNVLKTAISKWADRLSADGRHRARGLPVRAGR